MKQKTLSLWLKSLIILALIFGALIYGLYVPLIAHEMRGTYPELAWAYRPMLIFLEGTLIPCLAALGLAWSIASEIGCDNSFSHKNARSMMVIAILAAADVVYFRGGMIVFAILGASSGPVLLMSFLADVVGLAISVCAAVLSHLIKKAAFLKEENDLTV